MLRFATVALAVLVAAGPSLLAQDLSPDHEVCFDAQVDDQPDKRIVGCSRIIEHSLLSPQLRAAARIQRALAYATKSKNGEDMDRAISDLSEAMRMAPEDRQMQRRAVETRAGLYFENGDYDRAIEDYAILIRLDPESPTVYEYRGFVYATKGQHDRAIADFSEAIQRDPKMARLYNQRAWSRLLSGKPAEGLPDVDKALALDPNNAAFHVTRGLIYRGLGRAEESTSDLRKALALDPANEGIRQELHLTEASRKAAPEAEGKERGQFKAQEAGKAAEQPVAAHDNTDSRVAMAPTREASESTHSSLVPSDPGKLVRDLQTELKRIGCFDGAVDGDWGNQSKKALKDFTHHAKLSISNDEPTEDALRAAAAMKKRVCPVVCDGDEKLVDGRCVASQRKVHRGPTGEGRREARRYRAEPPSSSGGGSGGLKLCTVGGRQMAVCN